MSHASLHYECRREQSRLVSDINEMAEKGEKQSTSDIGTAILVTRYIIGYLVCDNILNVELELLAS